jgi:hypothetical protein
MNRLISSGRVIGTILVFMAATAWGQTPSADTAPSTPAPPFLNPAPALAAWQVQFESAGAKPGTPKEIDVAKVNDTRCDTMVMSDGTSTQLWYYKGMKIYQAPGAPYAIAMNPNWAGTPSAGAVDFPEVAWVNRANFVAKENKSGRSCYHYHEATDNGPLEAWIDAQTKLPVACQLAQGLETYTFPTPTVTTLTLPPLYQTAYDHFIKEQQSIKDQQTNVAP